MTEGRTTEAARARAMRVVVAPDSFKGTIGAASGAAASGTVALVAPTLVQSGTISAARVGLAALEDELAEFTGKPAALVFSSGYTANLGAVVALSGEKFLEGAWRIPYLISILLVVVGVWIRLRVDETDDYKDAQAARAAAPQGVGPPLPVFRCVASELVGVVA